MQKLSFLLNMNHTTVIISIYVIPALLFLLYIILQPWLALIMCIKKGALHMKLPCSLTWEAAAESCGAKQFNFKIQTDFKMNENDSIENTFPF